MFQISEVQESPAFRGRRSFLPLRVSVAELEKLGAKIERNEQSEVIAVSLRNTQITDAGAADLQQ
jgi:hypothetical protein